MSKNSIPSMAVIFFFILLNFLPALCTSRASIQHKINDNNPLIIRMKNSNDDLIQSTCKITPNYNLCIATLKSDPRSTDSDVSGLGLIIVDALKAKATSAVKKINQLKRSNPEYVVPLFQCSILYNAILKADVPVAVDGLRKGVPKFAENGMDDAAVEVRSCDESFKEENDGGAAPLRDVNQDIIELSVVAKSIIRLLL